MTQTRKPPGSGHEPAADGGPATPDPRQITLLLDRLGAGDRRAFDDLLPLVYTELRGIARRRLRGRPADATLNTTAVVHEAFLKLAGDPNARWNDRVHFFAVAARAMRQVLTDHARRRGTEKRGGDQRPVPLDEGQVASVGREQRRQAAWILDLDRALDGLRELSPRLAQVVECRYFGGMTDAEVADVVGVTARTVRRDWEKARAWLRRELAAEGHASDELST